MGFLSLLDVHQFKITEKRHQLTELKEKKVDTKTEKCEVSGLKNDEYRKTEGPII